MIRYPQIDPVIFHLGPLQPRWYGLMYLLGFLYAFRLIKKNWRYIGLSSPDLADSILATLVLGMILCSRFVYVVFYNLEETLEGPWWEAFAVWHGGLAFHGGFAGVLLATIYLGRKYKIKWQRLGDVLALSTPVGLGLGRIANFINGELWGRVSDVPWAMVFPGAGPLPRHPSQLYEAILEGPFFYLLLYLVWRSKPKVGVTQSCLVIFYALIRIFVENFREPDAQVGYLFLGLTMGQLLSFAMLALGSFMMWHALTKGEAFDANSQSPTTKEKKKA